MSEDKKLGEYIEVNSDIIDRVLDEQRQMSSEGQGKRLGEMLLEKQALTPESLQEAVMRQRLDRFFSL